jgi:lysophospholipase L1-like esterase
MKYHAVFRSIVFLSLVIITCKCSQPGNAIVFTGDSTIIGENVDQQSTFVSLLDQQFAGIEIADQTETGWTTATFMEEWDEIVGDFPGGPKIIFLQLGLNDLTAYGHKDATITGIMDNIVLIVEKMKDQYPDAEIVLLSHTKIDYTKMDEDLRSEGYESSTNVFLSRIAEGYSIIASENNINFLDLQRQVPIKSTYDGLHLSENGHNIVADVISRFLRELIRVNQIQI